MLPPRSWILPALAATLVLAALAPSMASADTWHSVDRPIDPSYQTAQPFGARSNWLQMWRAYMDTPPATKLRDGLGMNLNQVGQTRQVQAVAPLLADSGIKRVRYEINWNSVSTTQPMSWAFSSTRPSLQAIHDAGLRPLILLNMSSGGPCPNTAWKATLTQPARAGDTTIKLDSASAAKVKPGYTGLDQSRMAAGVLFKNVANDGTVTLSRPLPQDVAAGPQSVTTLAFEPFAQPQLADGSPNPRFARTLQGWLDYVGFTAREVRDVMGTDDFDIEIFNEMGWGAFLNIGKYYANVPDPGSKGNVADAVLSRTVAYLRDPANGVPNVKIGDGFANQTPNVSGADTPVGLTALDKHPYPPRYDLPTGSATWNHSIQPIDALGNGNYTLGRNAAGNSTYTDKFFPNYRAYFPEWSLTGTQTESVIREMTPITNSVYGRPHGRSAAPSGRSSTETWITEINVDPTVSNGDPDPLSLSDYDHIHAKVALRTYLSYINKGAEMVQIFGVKDAPQLSSVSPGFFDAAAANGWRYPGTATGGPTMDAIRRFAGTVKDAQTISRPRALTLDSISDNHDHVQFTGDGTANHPNLFNRDVLAVMPFQLDAHRFVAGVYVMTRDVTKVYDRSLPTSDPRRTDQPPETYRFQIGGVQADHVQASATDPLSGNSVPVSVVARNDDKVTFEMQASDSPRMLTIDDSPSNDAPKRHSRLRATVRLRTLRRKPHATADFLVACSDFCRVRWSARGRRTRSGSRGLRRGNRNTVSIRLPDGLKPRTSVLVQVLNGSGAVVAQTRHTVAARRSS